MPASQRPMTLSCNNSPLKCSLTPFMGVAIVHMFALTTALAADASLNSQQSTALPTRCEAPEVSKVPPVHGDGSAMQLVWNSPPTGSRTSVWAQWRIPEGPVLRTHESSHTGNEASLPESPQRGRPLMLQVEVTRTCPDGAISPPVLLRQLQYDPSHACPPVNGLKWAHRRKAPPREAVKLPVADDAPSVVSWRQFPGIGLILITFFDAQGRSLGPEQVRRPEEGNELSLPTSSAIPHLIRARRQCEAELSSTASYLRLR